MTYTSEMEAIWNAVREMQGNVFHIRQELPSVSMSEENRNQLLEVLAGFDGTLYDLRTEARNLEDKLGMHPGELPYDPAIKNPDPRVTMGFLRDWPFEDFQGLNRVVGALDAAGEELAYLLVADSAVNMLNAYQALGEALKSVNRKLAKND